MKIKPTSPRHGSTSPTLIAHEVGKASAVVDAFHAGRDQQNAKLRNAGGGEAPQTL